MSYCHRAAAVCVTASASAIFILVLRQYDSQALQTPLARPGYCSVVPRANDYYNYNNNDDYDEKEENKDEEDKDKKVLRNTVLVAAGILTDESQRLAYSAWIVPAMQRAQALGAEEPSASALCASSYGGKPGGGEAADAAAEPVGWPGLCDRVEILPLECWGRGQGRSR
ncbi:hypothetical protein ANO14919_137650 [Xylariales sp. No.14919]|nr:hypothetical protein ANO14919_137650 [Xylariales sp. No.14919]